jgi:hypothetical protein
MPVVKKLDRPAGHGLPAGTVSAPPATTRVLVIANRTADCPELRALLDARCARSEIQVTLVAPAAWEIVDTHGGRESALRRMRTARQSLRKAGIDISCVLGDTDPIQAFRNEWTRGEYDEVIVCTLPGQLSIWLHLDLPRRIRRETGGVLVTHVIGSCPGT